MFIVLLSMAKSLWEFTWVNLMNVDWHHVAANLYAKQLQTWPFSPLVGCHMLHPSPFVLLLNHKADIHSKSLRGWKAEST